MTRHEEWAVVRYVLEFKSHCPQSQVPSGTSGGQKVATVVKCPIWVYSWFICDKTWTISHRMIFFGVKTEMSPMVRYIQLLVCIITVPSKFFATQQDTAYFILLKYSEYWPIQGSGVWDSGIRGNSVRGNGGGAVLFISRASAPIRPMNTFRLPTWISSGIPSFVSSILTIIKFD